ncbi:indole-3-pyruvate monooxygenase [Ranunculus cassubicifolius]
MSNPIEAEVVIVGAGPAGLATARCLQQYSVSSTILEKENCCASLWKHRSYDRLKLHLAKEFCSLPHLKFPLSFPKFVPREGFIQYMDEYASKLNKKPLYKRLVQSATYDHSLKKWLIESYNTELGEVDIYKAQFLVVASGENSEGVIPKFPGMDTFPGEIIHSSQYRSGVHFVGKKTLVVGCGNSGMEIAYDLWNHGVNTSIVVRNPLHILNKEMVYIGMSLLKFIPLSFVDRLITFFAKAKYGDLTKFGLKRPEKGPFYLKATSRRSPVIDVGTIREIKRGNIKVNPGIISINEGAILFENGEEKVFDAIICATGYKSTTNNWLKDFYYVLNASGMPKMEFPNHWKGENGLYCAGFSSRGLAGISKDAEAIARDIKEKQKMMKRE